MARNCPPPSDPPISIKPAPGIDWECPPPEEVEPPAPEYVLGEQDTQRGNLLCWNGPLDGSAVAPGTAATADGAGVLWYLFVTADGIVRVHSAMPTQDTDGAVIATQF